MTPAPSSMPVVIVSNDTHVGPRLVEDLRPYCPAEYLEEFDRFAAMTAEQRREAQRLLGGSGYLDHPNLRTPGHHDPVQRLADYDHDGVAAGVLFHGSMNMEPIPFVPMTLGKATKYGDRDLTSMGFRIYNRWLADFVSVAPHRHIGLAYLPMWDMDAALEELEWAHEAGLKGINFPAMRDGDLPEYNKRSWEPLWRACEERRMPLVTHVGSATNADYSGLESVALLQVESGNFVSKRAIWWLIFAGVFERHPGLKLMITETPGSWFAATAEELDGVYSWYEAKREEPLNQALFRQVPRRPSEYMGRNVYFGASFASPFEVRQAVSNGLEGRLLWGSDYPHLEGTFVYSESRDVPSVTRASLRHTFCEIPPEKTRRMVGDNAIDVYGLDRVALQKIARQIGAPSMDDLRRPIDAVPEGASATAFRSGAGGWS